jgi:hypothetical protein
MSKFQRYLQFPTAMHYLLVAFFLQALAWSLSTQASPSTTASKTALTPKQIVEMADRIRFPAEGFQVNVKITTTRPDSKPEVKKYLVLSKGNDRTLLMTTFPVIDKGNILLMRDLDLWAFLPRLSQPVRLPLAQKLTGEVANGDLARANFSGDYDATLLRTEDIDKTTYYVLELKANRRGVTYNRVLYWVNKENYWPYKAEFFTLSNRLIKTSHYQSYETIGGAVRPTQLIIENALKKQERSVMEYSNMQLRTLKNKMFTKDYLKKLIR